MFSPDVAKIIDSHRAAKMNKTSFRNPNYDDSGSDTETNVDSLYDNHNFGENESETMGESEFGVESDDGDSYESLQRGLDRITSNYVQKVKTEINEAISHMKVQGQTKAAKKVQERGAGDKKNQSKALNVLKKVEVEKKECYRKIGAVLDRMKNLDRITEELANNNFNNF